MPNKEKKKMQTGIHVGAEKGAIEAAHKALLAILSAKADQQTIQKALDAFMAACKVENTAISGCTFTSK